MNSKSQSLHGNHRRFRHQLHHPASHSTKPIPVYTLITFWGYNRVLKAKSQKFLLVAFVVHARHATVYLFYAKFPNTYLRDIARYGAEYKQRVVNPSKIQTCQSRPYRMRHPQHQPIYIAGSWHFCVATVSFNLLLLIAPMQHITNSIYNGLSVWSILSCSI